MSMFLMLVVYIGTKGNLLFFWYFNLNVETYEQYYLESFFLKQLSSVEFFKNWFQSLRSEVSPRKRQLYKHCVLKLRNEIIKQWKKYRYNKYIVLLKSVIKSSGYWVSDTRFRVGNLFYVICGIYIDHVQRFQLLVYRNIACLPSCVNN